ncbi:hypothetical protein Nepgr_033873 [Nepenthes gracilis]|uniref:Uncharacterized protein n=1 Tax=Nepenthes gracilis TaxID=150966 RepID=A0AAD3TMT0_NEPGR|nr:hypothetical protein Nepgr_033873 [Nepenthes gracilis]
MSPRSNKMGTPFTASSQPSATSGPATPSNHPQHLQHMNQSTSAPKPTPSAPQKNRGFREQAETNRGFSMSRFHPKKCPTSADLSNLDRLTSEDVPVDVGPNPGAVIPPSDGVSPETELAPIIDLNLTPSPIARILKKYSLSASKIEESSSSSSVGSSVRAMEKSRSRSQMMKVIAFSIIEIAFRLMRAYVVLLEPL